jgi:hypothetical protein
MDQDDREMVMATPVLNSYADVQQYLDNLIATLGSNIGGAPHGAFWNTMNYQQFTTGNVPGVSGNWKVLEVGSSTTSNIILALRGDSPFDGSTFPQMPADGPPFADAGQIQPLADWIDHGCPNR